MIIFISLFFNIFANLHHQLQFTYINIFNDASVTRRKWYCRDKFCCTLFNVHCKQNTLGLIVWVQLYLHYRDIVHRCDQHSVLSWLTLKDAHQLLYRRQDYRRQLWLTLCFALYCAVMLWVKQSYWHLEIVSEILCVKMCQCLLYFV